jgi:rRNA pseudouridine-1189 N-methylase Emg1 (Nep1/Mra1 family)
MFSGNFAGSFPRERFNMTVEKVRLEKVSLSRTTLTASRAKNTFFASSIPQ